MKFEPQFNSNGISDNFSKSIGFNNLDELMDISDVKKFKFWGTDDERKLNPYFKEFALQKFAEIDDTEIYLLFVRYEYKEKVWPLNYWVAGFIFGSEAKNLGLKVLQQGDINQWMTLENGL